MSSIFSTSPSKTSSSPLKSKPSPKAGSGGSLTASLFGSTTGPTSAAFSSPPSLKSNPSSSLFDNATQEKYHSVVRDRAQKNSKSFHPSKHSSSTSTSVDTDNDDVYYIMTEEEKETVLAMRKRRTNNPVISKMVSLLNVDLSTIASDNHNDSHNNGNIHHNHDIDMMQEDLHGATMLLANIVREMGVGTVTSPNSSLASNTKVASKFKTLQLFSPAILEEMSAQAKLIQEEICNRLEEKGIHDFEAPSKSNLKPSSSKISSLPSFSNNSIFRYHEVASRCQGRMDVRHRTSSRPFTHPDVVSNPILLPAVQNLLGADAKLLYCGLIYSFPNSSDQPWHVDGSTLFPELAGMKSDCELDFDCMVDLPPYALNIFIPLGNDITEDIGATEFFPGSHLNHKAMEIDEDLLQLRLFQPMKNQQHKPPVPEKKRASSSASASKKARAAKATVTVATCALSKNDSDHESDGIVLSTDILAVEEEVMNRHTVIAPLLKQGDALIYDYRVCHRGTANLSFDGTTRIMLYLMYARPWFREHLNFGEERLFD